MPSRMPITITTTNPVSTRSQFTIATLRFLVDSTPSVQFMTIDLRRHQQRPFLDSLSLSIVVTFILQLRSDHPSHSIDHPLYNPRISTQDVVYLRVLERSSIVDIRLRLPSPCTIADMLHLILITRILYQSNTSSTSTRYLIPTRPTPPTNTAATPFLLGRLTSELLSDSRLYSLLSIPLPFVSIVFWFTASCRSILPCYDNGMIVWSLWAFVVLVS